VATVAGDNIILFFGIILGINPSEMRMFIVSVLESFPGDSTVAQMKYPEMSRKV